MKLGGGLSGSGVGLEEEGGLEGFKANDEERNIRRGREW